MKVMFGEEKKKTKNKTQKLKTLSFILRHINHGFGVVQDTKGQYWCMQEWNRFWAQNQVSKFGNISLNQQVCLK